MKKIVGAIFFLTMVGWLAFYLYRTQVPPTQTVLSSVNEAIQEQLHPSPIPSPFLFEDVTIPFLRRKTYTSTLGDLQRLNETGTYTSYLTSYTSDGLRVNALLTQPKGTAPAGGWPAIIFIHGYIAPTRYSTQGPQYTAYVDYLAQNGFVVFKIDLRGHGQSEGEAGGAYYSSDYIIDALNAYAALQNTPFVNKDKIGLWGHSMAGNVVFRSLAVNPSIKGAVIWAGAVYSYEDFQKYGINDDSYRPPSTSSQRQRRRQELFNAHGQFSKESAFWQQVAATNYLVDMKTPLEIHHAVDDAVVPIGYSRDLVATLAGSTVPHQLFEYNSGGHNISGANFNQAMQRTIEFFTRTLKN